VAKITPSALITAIQGTWGHDTFQMLHSAIIRRRTGKPHHSPIESRARWRSIASDIAGKWDALAADDKTAWNNFADDFPVYLSGFNAFMACNTALVYANHPALCYYPTVLTSYYIPPTPSPLSLYWIGGSSSFCVSWTTPACTSQFVQVFFCPQAGYSSQRFPKLRLAKTEQSDALITTINGSNYPANTVIHFQVRTLDVYGMRSAWSNVATCTRG